MVESQPKPSESSPTIPIPSATATPSEVRTYFTNLLNTYHDLSEEVANETASKWTLGRGEEMSSLDIETYRQIFGWETGTILFRHVNQYSSSKTSNKAPVSEPERQRPKQDIFGMVPGVVLIYFCLVAMLLLAGLAYFESDKDRAAAMMIVSVLFMMGFGASYTAFYFA